jgi:cytochrome c-type biogenesis protein CcmH
MMPTFILRRVLCGLLLPCLILVSVCMQTASAAEATLLQTNAAVEAQVQRLAEELRCLVCQNQTLADSHAGLAMDLKQEIREMAMQGMSDSAITEYLVTRYGDFIRYRPPLKLSTALLWFGPFMLLLASGTGLAMKLRRRQRESTDTPLTAAEARKVKELLDKES